MMSLAELGVLLNFTQLSADILRLSLKEAMVFLITHADGILGWVAGIDW